MNEKLLRDELTRKMILVRELEATVDRYRKEVFEISELRDANDLLKRGLLENGDSVEEHCCEEYKQKLLAEIESLKEQLTAQRDSDDSIPKTQFTVSGLKFVRKEECGCLWYENSSDELAIQIVPFPLGWGSIVEFNVTGNPIRINACEETLADPKRAASETIGVLNEIYRELTHRLFPED